MIHIDLVIIVASGLSIQK